ncbi:hypothetical protein Patl1_10913 [Pistacia atlantica]|uniref:Uncharacterized protein n=1 Tax=Pistacia atlantica TaxID=434234 RepID=A0ACC1A4V1_9ROSI|nr:hypothetical protein Patl1_10913 [Pistacia atlantica]
MMLSFTNFPKCQRLVQGQVHILLIRNWHKEPIPVAWKKPEFGWTKLNFDGSCKGGTGKGSIGGVFRNHKAEFLLGYSESIGRTTSTIAELAALRRGLELSFLAGLAASGALTSALRLITVAAFEKYQNGLRNGVMLFLAICTFFEFLCILLYAFLFPKLPIVKYFRSKAALEGSKTVSSDLAAAGIQTKVGQAEDEGLQQQRLSVKQLFFQNIDYALDLFLIYVLTLSIFPGFLYEDTGHHQLGDTWYPLVLIASYNVWDLISRYVPLVECLKLESRKGLMIAILARFLLVPAFYFTAKYADQGWMIMLTSFLGLTNGYLAVWVLTVAPKGYKGPEQNALGNILVLCLLGGIFAGVALDWLWLIGKKQGF